MANLLSKEAETLGLNFKVVDLIDFRMEDPSILQQNDVKIFILATHGEGEPTNNAQIFYSWMQKAIKNNEKDLVKGDITVFGLGDSQYEKFNKMGKDSHKFLLALGGTEAFKYGESDHEYGTADIVSKYFDPWKENLWEELFKRYAQEGEV